MGRFIKDRGDGSRGNTKSTRRDKKDPQYRTRLYSVRLTTMIREWLEDHVPSMGRSGWVESAIVYCIQLEKDERFDDPFTALRFGLYLGFCKGVVYAREETDPNIDGAIERHWAAFAKEIPDSPPRHWNAPMPERMMSQIRRPLDEILGADPAAGPSAGRRMNMGVGLPYPGESAESAERKD